MLNMETYMIVTGILFIIIVGQAAQIFLLKQEVRRWRNVVKLNNKRIEQLMFNQDNQP